MKQTGQRLSRFLRHGQGPARRVLCLALCAVFAAALFPSSALAQGELVAPNSTRAQGTLANLVIGVRFSDTTEENDILADPAVWQLVRGMYDTDEDSFANYIRTVSQGRLTVQNYFPQETAEAEVVAPFSLFAGRMEEQETDEALPEDEALTEESEAPAETEESGKTGEPEEPEEPAGETPDADTAPEPTAAPESPEAQPTAAPEGETPEAPEPPASAPDAGAVPETQPTAEPAAQPEQTPDAGPVGEPSSEADTTLEQAAGSPDLTSAGQDAAVQPAPPETSAGFASVHAASGAQSAQDAPDAAESGAPCCATLQLSGTAASYLQNEQAMIREIIAALADGSIPLPAGKLDNSAAGVLDNLTVIVPAGTQFIAHSTTYAGGETFAAKQVGCYNVQLADGLVSTLGSTPSVSLSGGQGVIIHEFLHTLGLPDLYRKDGSGAPVGIFSIMASALSAPQYPLEALREQLGWIDPIPEITTSGTYTIRLPNAPVDEANKNIPTAYKLRGVRSGYDSETFVLEHRYEKYPGSPFDQYLTKSGLLMYRVDTSVPDHTNYGGENYIYVFRENAESVAGANEKVGTANRVLYAPRYPVAESNGITITVPAETSYGSTDLDATFRENTLFYSDGSNSGIAITDIHYSKDHQLMTFTVTLADPSAGEWQASGGAVSGVGPGCVALAECGGSLYAATVSPITQGPQTLTLWQRPAGDDSAAWTKAAGLTGLYANPPASLLCYQGGLWLATQNASGQPVVYRYQNGTLSPVSAAPDANAMQPQLVEYSGSLYLAYCQSGSKALVLRRVTGSGPEPPALTVSGYLANPALAAYDGKLAVLYSDFNAAAGANTSRVAVCDGNGWSQLYDTGIPAGKLHALASSGSELAAFVGNDAGQYGVWAYHSGSWSALGSPVSGTLQGMQLLYSDGQLYVAAHGSDQKLTFWRWTSGGWEAVGDAVTNEADAVSAPVVQSGRFYQVYLTGTTSSSGGRLVLRAFTPTPVSPVEEDYTVRLFLESEAAETTVYVDGVAHPVTTVNGAVQLQLADGAARTVTWYPTNDSGVPTGMRVWLLQFVRGRYLATEQTALQDLLTYHGFSIRISGNAGIRFKTGISTSAKQALTSAAGLDGYRLVEYGTLVMNQKYANSYPFVLGSEKVARGRSYWTANGKTNDYVFETVSGRQRFTSVLVDLPADKYKVEYAFRGYIILQKDGQSYTFYGPPLARSICYLAERLISRGEYAAGSREDAFLRKILADAV